MISFASVDLHIRTTGLFPYRSIPITMYGLPVACLLESLPGKSFCFSCPGSVNTGGLIFLVDGNCYSKFLPELMHALQLMHLFSIYLLIADHQMSSVFGLCYCCSRPAFSSSWYVRSVAFPTTASSILRGLQFCQPQIKNQSFR